MQYDVEQAIAHLKLLSGQDNSLETFQHFFDPQGVPVPKGLADHFTSRLNNSLEYLEHYQKKLCGIYITVNETDGKGRKEPNVTRYRNFYVDYDKMSEPTWAKPPTVSTKRGDKNGHAFWKIKDDITKREWIRMQKWLILFYGTDATITLPQGVIRLAGFLHLKDPQDPKMYRIDITNPQASYTIAEMEASMPLNAAQMEALNDWENQEQAVLTGTGYESNKHYTAALINWAKIQAKPAVEGEGSKELIKVAAWGHDRGIPVQETIAALWEHYNPRCVPPWDNTENDKIQFSEIIMRAYTGAKSAAGCKTAKAYFSQRTLPERTDGWVPLPDIEVADPPKKIFVKSDEKDDFRDFGRMSRKEAIIAKKNMDGKMAEMDIALIYDGCIYDGRQIYRVDKMFYRFNGKTYDYIPDDIIKAEIQAFCYKDKPPSSRVNGIFNSFCNACTREKLENGTWIDEPERDGKNMSVFNNGIVDMSLKNPDVIPHTYRYFCFSKKDFDFDPKAQCPKFMAFLKEVFEHDPDNIILLMEYIGLLLTNELKYQKFIFLKGKSRGGKGVITNLIRELVGKDNCANPPLQTLNKDAVLHALSTKTVGFFGDVRTVNMNLREAVLSTLLQITGQDDVLFDVKFKGAQNIGIPTRFIMTGNDVPTFIDINGALINRMLLVTFEKTFKGRENVNLLSELSTEYAGITNLAMKHYQAMQKRGKFTEPESGIIEKEEIKRGMFPLSTFIESSCIIDKKLSCSATNLFRSYLVNCQQNSIKMSLTPITFNKQLKGSDLDITSVRKTIDGVKEIYFIGIGLNDSAMNIISLDNVKQFPNRIIQNDNV